LNNNNDNNIDMPPLALSEPANNEMVAMEESEDDWQSDEDLGPLTEEQGTTDM
jgi:hypothetical protein